MGEKNYKKELVNFFCTAFIFLVVVFPCRILLRIVEVTEIRPANALNPVFGIFFGWSGALGCAAGNLISDLTTGFSLSSSIAGFFIQILFGMIPYWCWKYIVKDTLRFDTSRKVTGFMQIIFLNSLVNAAILGLYMWNKGWCNFFSTTTFMLFFNDFVFGLVLGIPLFLCLVTHQIKKQKKQFSINEKFILIFLGLGILAAAITGFVTREEAGHFIDDDLLLWNKVYVNIAVVLFLFSFLTVFIIKFIEVHVTIPMEKMSDTVRKYVDSDATKEFASEEIINDCKKFSELPGETGVLAKAFCEMSANIKSYIRNLSVITAEKERIGAELNVATNIQASMLPKIFPAFPEQDHFFLFASMSPAKEVGGDFYDFYFTDENHLVLIMADVSGKGIPAALFMVIAKTIIKNIALQGSGPKEILEKANVQLCENNEEEMFVSVWIGILDVTTGKMVCSNAGHEFPAICRKGENFSLLKDKHGFVVGGLETAKYIEYEIQLEKGDEIFVYTDGVPEATNGENVLFGNDRMVEALNRANESEISGFLGSVRNSVDEFVGSAPQFDDLTMMILKYRG